MALETGTYISDLVATNPTSGDPKSQGDDHLRLIKSTVKASFPNVSGAVTATHTQLNRVAERGYISGLIQSTAGSSSTITVSAGEAADSTAADILTLSSSINKTTSAWALGSGNGGLDTGAIAPSSSYFLWAIKRVDTGVVDVLISLSASAPTMPTNYTLKRLIGFARTNGSSQWESFTAYEETGGGIYIGWSSPTIEMSTTGLGAVRSVTTPVGVPSGFSVAANIQMVATNASTFLAKVCCPDETDATPSASAAPGADFFMSGGVADARSKVVRTNASGQIAARSTLASTTMRIFCNGFSWSRR